MRSLPLLAIALLACTPTPYQLGVRAAADGAYVKACEHWIQALDRDVTQVKPRSALLEYGPKAYGEFVELAQEHEASKRYEDALEAYADALDFGNELDELELLEFSLEDVKIEVVEVKERWADYEWASAIAADEAAEWAKAIEHFETFRTLRPDNPELDERQGLTYLLWAEDDVATKRFTDGAEHYRRAHALTGRQSLEDWAGAIELALGRYGLQKEKCRYAFERFEAAGVVKNEPTFDAEKAKAWDCARKGIDLQPLAQTVDAGVEGIDAGAMLFDRIEHEIERQGSRYVVLLAGQTENQPEDRVQVSVRLTQATVEPRRQGATDQKVTGYQSVECDKETLLYEPDAVCSEEVEVHYKLNRAAQVIRLAGTVKIIDTRAGEQKTRPLEVTLQHDTTHASEFQVYDGAGGMKDVTVAIEVDPHRVEVPAEVVALDREPEPLPPVSDVLRDAVALMAAEAGRVVIEAADFEEPPPEPAFLTIKEPIALPQDLDFAQPTLAEPEPDPIEAMIEPVAPDPSPEGTAVEPDVPGPVTPPSPETP